MSFDTTFRVSYRSPEYTERRSATFKSRAEAKAYAKEKMRDGRTSIRIDVKEVQVTKWHIPPSNW